MRFSRFAPNWPAQNGLPSLLLNSEYISEPVLSFFYLTEEVESEHLVLPESLCFCLSKECVHLYIWKVRWYIVNWQSRDNAAKVMLPSRSLLNSFITKRNLKTTQGMLMCCYTLLLQWSLLNNYKTSKIQAFCTIHCAKRLFWKSWERSCD